MKVLKDCDSMLTNHEVLKVLEETLKKESKTAKGRQTKTLKEVVEDIIEYSLFNS